MTAIVYEMDLPPQTVKSEESLQSLEQTQGVSLACNDADL
jgi:hypothetical protein